MRIIPHTKGELAHVYNRGTDKRRIFDDKFDLRRFLICIILFNQVKPVGAVRNVLKKSPSNLQTLDVCKLEEIKNQYVMSDPLVSVKAFAALPNHFHFLIEPEEDGGVSEFMKRLGGGYTKFFNERHKRSGVLFQGKYKSALIRNDARIAELSAYINLNFKIHKSLGKDHPLVFTTMDEYKHFNKGKTKMIFSDPSLVMDNFANFQNYKSFAQDAVKSIRMERGLDKNGDLDLME